MLAIPTLSLIAWILFSVAAYDLPRVEPPTHRQLKSRGSVTSGSSSQSLATVSTGLLSASCGLSTNVWGQVTAVSSSGYANLCLQCRVNVLGVTVSFGYYSALAASINAYGVSAGQIAVLQSSIDSALLTLSAQQKTSASCKTACAADTRCQSYTFTGSSCKFTSVNYSIQNKAGTVLAQAFQSLYSSGGSGFCSLCSSDRSCTGVPTASGVARRSLAPRGSSKGERKAQGNSKCADPATPSAAARKSVSPRATINSKCPTGLSACPILSGSSLTSSGGFECLNVQQEATSCGGCSSTGEGVDCTTLPGTSSTGCSEGKCQIFSCKSGYLYSSVDNSCSKSTV
ncbi:hypothetical protein PCANC_10900 [Puccinia coronata f. sp. avenae]|uniref:Protein CPL1-like domain-containing protein n=1 Tax=Puccinia coronata f. sp. avenae TaxID=200324 RepID=A0A2N5SWR7_9BASI|nr:hypothetical protein PCANC_10900 [Puccinia coronata f. sp. avenae]